MRTVDNFIEFFENEFTDIRKQSSWDFSGRQIYLGNHEVSKVCVALDPSLDVIMQAIHAECSLLITHHPLFMKPPKNIDIRSIAGQITVKAVQNNLSILSYHTNLDMALYGTSKYLLDKIGACDLGILEVEGEDEFIKFVVFTPKTHADKVLQAAFDAGAGHISNYSGCSFSCEGTGTFIPDGEATPFIGSAGKTESVKEMRQEFIVPKALQNKVLDAVKNAHPYEECVIDILNIQSNSSYGYGKIGSMNRKYELIEFINVIKEKLEVKNIRVNTDSHKLIDKFAVCSGSGAGLWRECAAKGIDTLITGDVKHHDALDARQEGICIVDIGHFESERIYMEFIARYIKQKFQTDVLIAEEKTSLIYL